MTTRGGTPDTGEVVFERFRALVVEQLGVEETEVTRDSNLMTDLGADSLDIVELVMDAEVAFHIEIEDDALAGLATVADCVTLIDAVIAKKVGARA